MMIELEKVQREIKVYINDRAFVLDGDKASGQQLLEKAGFAINEYDIYLVLEGNNKNRQIKNNGTVNREIGMRFNVILRSSQSL